MDIHFTIRSDQVKEAAKECLQEKLHKLDKVHIKVEDAHAILDVQKYRNIVEVALSGKHLRIAAKEEDRDMIVAIDRVILKLNHQLLKRKEILKQKKGSESRKFASKTEAQEP
jgi:ribosomal subunit interface protein